MGKWGRYCPLTRRLYAGGRSAAAFGWFLVLVLCQPYPSLRWSNGTLERDYLAQDALEKAYQSVRAHLQRLYPVGLDEN